MAQAASPGDVQYAFALTLVDEWVRCGLTDAVVAPGSRSTPMAYALHNDQRVRLHIVLDERSAGFVALGLGLGSGVPALVVTTSGTAAVELHPAIVEAYQAGVPLVAVTTDRPPDLHHVGAPQTVEQGNLFSSVVGLALDPGLPDLATSATWRSLAARMWAEAAGPRFGGGEKAHGAQRRAPVHLNLPFREPLMAASEDKAASLVPPGRPASKAWHELLEPAPSYPSLGTGDHGLSPESLPEEGVIVAGAGAGDPDAVLGLSEALGWPVFADPRSGCRRPHPNVVGHADAILRLPEVAGWTPGAVLRLGAPWASKVLARWLADLPASTAQILVDPHNRWADPDRRASTVLSADPTALCLAIAAGSRRSPDGRWLTRWRTAEGAAARAIAGALDGKGGAAGALDGQGEAAGALDGQGEAAGALDGQGGACGASGLTEPAIARTVVGSVPPGGTVVVSSSMPVRDVEWYTAPRSELRVLANRGANGIDGVVSTALGVGLATKAPVVGLIGDLAFLYDVGALLWAARRALSVTFVVVDNDGGGIFSFLPQAKATDTEAFERLWGTPHGLDVGTVAAGYGVKVQEAATLGSIAEFLRNPEEGVRVIVARTDRAANVGFHDRLHRSVADSVAKALG